MTTNNPEIKAYLISDKTQPKMRGVRLYEGYDPSLLDTRSDCEYEPMVLLSDYEALRAECAKLAAALDAMIKGAGVASWWGYFPADTVSRAVEALTTYRRQRGEP